MVGIFILFIMQNEIWKSVKGYEGIYEISSLGRVKSLNYNRKGKEKLLKLQLDNLGYFHVMLSKKGKAKTLKVHKLVAIDFLNHNPCKSNLVVNHINFIRHDNRVENLELVTIRENSNKKHIKSSSKYTGVTWHKTAKKWQSVININGINKYLGLFNDELEASKAYQNELLKINNNIL